MTVQSQAKSAAALEGDAASVSSDAVALLTQRVDDAEATSKKQLAELKGEVTATTDELAAAVIAVQTDSGAAADKLSAVDTKLEGLAQQQTLTDGV